MKMAGRTAAVGGLEGKLKTLHAKELGEGSKLASSDLGSLAVFNVEQVALNRHVSSTPNIDSTRCSVKAFSSEGVRWRIPPCEAEYIGVT
jgi:hypothetical protein